jgi:hypothetical protein
MPVFCPHAANANDTADAAALTAFEAFENYLAQGGDDIPKDRQDVVIGEIVLGVGGARQFYRGMYGDDGEGEPMCPDSCSFFSNWEHTFPSCPGGEAFHHDYWIWLDDTPAGGISAIGGDWGLRMPLVTLTGSFQYQSSNITIIEHEIGHGFGFQDYYDWTGAVPEGGSLMIVRLEGRVLGCGSGADRQQAHDRHDMKVDIVFHFSQENLSSLFKTISSNISP